jgi:hypothetical protein
MNPALDDVILHVAERARLAVELLTCPTWTRNPKKPLKSPSVVAARRRAMWACKQVCPDASLPEIGRAFNRDNATVRQQIHRFEELRTIDPDEREEGERITQHFRSLRQEGYPAREHRSIDKAIVDRVDAFLARIKFDNGARSQIENDIRSLLLHVLMQDLAIAELMADRP